MKSHTLHAVTSASFERNANVIPINSEVAERQYETQINQVTDSFRSLFDDCRGPDASPYAFERQIEIVVQNEDLSQSQRKETAIVRTLLPGWSQYAVGFDIADGFEVIHYERDPAYGHHVLKILSFQSIYNIAGRRQNIGEGREVNAWLRKCAKDPELNPELAQNISDVHKKRVVARQLALANVAFFPKFNHSPGAA